MPSIRKLMKLLVIASFQINFFDLACCFFRNKIYSDIEIWSPLLKRPSNFSNLESYFLLAVFVFKSKVSIQAGLEIATNTVANATNSFSLATKNSGLVATLATRFLY